MFTVNFDNQIFFDANNPIIEIHNENFKCLRIQWINDKWHSWDLPNCKIGKCHLTSIK